MILLIAVLAGLMAALVRARLTGRKLRSIQLNHWWLVVVAFIPQLVAFGPWARSNPLPEAWLPPLLLVSQALLLLFAWFNRSQSGFWCLGFGLLLNFLVILLNGGAMPISPETARRMLPDAPQGAWQVGERFGYTKDRVLTADTTRLAFLSDRFVLPGGIIEPVAFSMGDVFIAVGAFWLLWSLADPQPTPGS